MLDIKKILNENSKKSTISEDDKIKLRQCLLYMYNEIDIACKKYGLTLCSSNGTTLGAIRHKGFIPWDDDLDLALSRSDYNKFSEVYEKELKDRYEISFPQGEYNATNRFLQLYRKGTELYIDLDEKYPHHMVYIDIFPVDYVPDNRIIRWLKGGYCNFLMLIAACVADVEYDSDEYKRTLIKTIQGRILYLARKSIGQLFSFRPSSWWFHLVDRKVQYKESRDAAIVLGRVHYFGEIIPQTAWFPYRKVAFENISMNVPNKPAVYLRQLYGKSYMELPPLKDRESHFINKVKVLKEIDNNI